MNVVSLEGLEYFAFHGVSKEEQSIGHRFGIDVDLYTNFEKAAQNDDLNGTIDYGVLSKIITEEMQIVSKLLEHVLWRIINRIEKELDGVFKVDITMRKFDPPVNAVCKASKIRIVHEITSH